MRDAKKNSVVKSKAMMDVLGKRWWDKHIIVLEDQKVTWGPYKHSAVLGPAVKPVFWLKFIFIVPHSGFLALVLQLCWMNLYGRMGLTAKVV